jgi:hypothetical protein
MAQPRDYTRQYNFNDYQATSPSDPLRGSEIDGELNAVKLTLDDLNANIAKIQRDDGKLGNTTVHKDAFDQGALAIINSTFKPRGNWSTASSYAVNDAVNFNGATYVATAAHTSSAAFATDIAASRWILIANAAIAGTSSAVDKFEGDGSTTAFTLSYSYESETSFLVFVNGELLNPVDDYTLSGSTLTLFTAPGLPTVAGNENVIVWGASVVGQAAKEAAEAAESNASGYADEAESWASKTNGIVESTDYSSKAWSIGGTGVDTGSGSAKDWASKLGATVGNTSEYSSKYWATQGDVPIVAAGIANITTVAGQISPTNNVATLAGINAAVTNLSGISAAVSTVSGISADVSTVAALSSTNLNTVATNIGSVTTVATNIAKVITVANDLTEAISEIETVADDLNEAVSEIEVVAGAITNVDLVGGSISSVNTLAAINTAVVGVNSISANVTAVNNISSNIVDVDNNSANINTVAGLNTEITNLNGISSTLTSVNNNSANINAVNANSTNINSVAAASSNISAVGGSIANVNVVATNITSVNAFGNQYEVSASEPSSPNEGLLWFDVSTDTMKVYNGSSFQNAGSSVNGTSSRGSFTATAGRTSFATTGYDSGYIDVYLNGVKLIEGTDFTATDGTNFVLTTGAALNDTLDYVAYGTFNLANVYTKTVSDARYYTQTASDARYLQQTQTDARYLQQTQTDALYLPLTGGTISTDLIVTGNLTVNGTQTIVNSTTLDVADLNITIANGAADAAAANGAGITVDGASATFNYAATGDKWTMNKPLDVTGTVNATAFTGDGSGLTGVGFTTNVVTSSTTATKDNHYYLSGATLTLTLPASPSVGDEVRLSEVAGNTDCIVGRNGSNIMGDASDLTIDSAYLVLSLRYVDATIGWAFS